MCLKYLPSNDQNDQQLGRVFPGPNGHATDQCTLRALGVPRRTTPLLHIGIVFWIATFEAEEFRVEVEKHYGTFEGVAIPMFQMILRHSNMILMFAFMVLMMFDKEFFMILNKMFAKRWVNDDFKVLDRPIR